MTPIAVGRRLADPCRCEDGQHLVVINRIEVAAHRRIGEHLLDRLLGRSAVREPALGKAGMSEVEDEELQPLGRLEIVDDVDRFVPAGDDEPVLPLDRPQRIGLGDCAHRLERLRDDAVDQAVRPDAVLAQPGDERGRCLRPCRNPLA